MINNTFKLSKSEKENLIKEFYDLAKLIDLAPLQIYFLVFLH